MDMNLSKLQEMVKERRAWHAAVHGVAKSWTARSDWTAAKRSWVNFWVPLHNCPLEGPQTLCSHSLLALFLRRILCQALWGFPGGSDGKESACNVGDQGLIPGLGRSLGKGGGYTLQYSFLENPMDRGAWRATVHGVTKSWTQVSGLDTCIYLSNCKNDLIKVLLIWRVNFHASLGEGEIV